MTHRPSPRNRRGTSWDPVADWYAGWVGEFGSEHHRRLAIPTVLDLLELRRDQHVLDIGSGHGVLARPVLQVGARYTGVDVSGRLIEMGRRTYGNRARFYVGDAGTLDVLPSLGNETFDAAVFLLSIQDINPLESAIANAAYRLAPGGRLVIFMTHPAFRIPRHSGWGWDEGRKLRFRRVDSYLSRMEIPLRPTATRKNVSVTFHRPIEAYVDAMAAAGLVIDAIREVPTYKSGHTGATAKAENAANREFPLFMAIRAWKLSG